MTACYDQGHAPVPEDPAKLQGPPFGPARYFNAQYPRWDGVEMRVIERSYVWSPEQHRPDGYHGFRHYEWSVVEWDRDNDGRPGRMVVNDTELAVITTDEATILADILTGPTSAGNARRLAVGAAHNLAAAGYTIVKSAAGSPSAVAALRRWANQQ